MGEGLTRAAARNIFYGGSLFFFVVFAALVAHSHWYAINHVDRRGRTDRGRHPRQAGVGAQLLHQLPHAARRGRLLRARTRQCLGPLRRPGRPAGRARGAEGLDPVACPPASRAGGRCRSFNLTDQELDDLASFLEWVSKIDTQGWPPNEAG